MHVSGWLEVVVGSVRAEKVDNTRRNLHAKHHKNNKLELKRNSPPARTHNKPPGEHAARRRRYSANAARGQPPHARRDARRPEDAHRRVPDVQDLHVPVAP